MNKPISEHDEFLLSELIDGALPEDQACALRARIECEPAMRVAYEGLQRVEGLLIERRREPVEIDWGRFRAGVMEQVEREAAGRSKVIKLNRWLKVMTPLAMAACVALVVTAIYLPQGQEPSEPGPINVAVNRPTEFTDDIEARIKVEVNRPSASDIAVAVGGPQPGDDGGTAGISVQFTQSTELAEVVEQMDQMRENEPSLRRYRASVAPNIVPPPVPDDVLFADEPQL